MQTQFPAAIALPQKDLPARPGRRAGHRQPRPVRRGSTRVTIRHGEQLYRLRATSQNKLILTK